MPSASINLRDCLAQNLKGADPLAEGVGEVRLFGSKQTCLERRFAQRPESREVQQFGQMCALLLPLVHHAFCQQYVVPGQAPASVQAAGC